MFINRNFQIHIIHVHYKTPTKPSKNLKKHSFNQPVITWNSRALIWWPRKGSASQCSRPRYSSGFHMDISHEKWDEGDGDMVQKKWAKCCTLGIWCTLICTYYLLYDQFQTVETSLEFKTLDHWCYQLPAILLVGPCKGLPSYKMGPY